MLRTLTLRWLATSFALAGVSSLAIGGATAELLEPEKAFHIAARALDRRNVEIEFKIADGYYMYRERFVFANSSGRRLAGVEIPHGKIKVDPFFGKTETFRGSVQIRVPIAPVDIAPDGRVMLKVTSQGCSDSGVCYIPLDQTVVIVLPRVR